MLRFKRYCAMVYFLLTTRRRDGDDWSRGWGRSAGLFQSRRIDPKVRCWTCGSWLTLFEGVSPDHPNELPLTAQK